MYSIKLQNKQLKVGIKQEIIKEIVVNQKLIIATIVPGQQKVLKVTSYGLDELFNNQDKQSKIDNCLSVQIEQNSRIINQTIKNICFVGSQCFLLLQNPIELYFIHQKHPKLIPILLDTLLELSNCVTWISYPDIYIYGHCVSKYTNHLYSLNLTTFQIKQLSGGKGYNPGGRQNYFAVFSDERLYVCGGVDKKGKPCENLLWTFNFQNGYWFALELKTDDLLISLPTPICQVENGKILILKEKNLRLFELYQSKISTFDQISEQVKQQIEKNQIQGFFSLKGLNYAFNKQKILPFILKVQRVKKP